MNDDSDLESLAREVGAALHARGLMLVTAESCTGGWVAEVVTSVAGSSAWFERGFVTYSNLAKREQLAVPGADLELYGAVSEEVACAMALGALARSRGDVAVAVTGIAGPDGGSDAKPVGTVFVAWGRRGSAPHARRFRFPGDRREVRRCSVHEALTGILALLSR